MDDAALPKRQRQSHKAQNKGNEVEEDDMDTDGKAKEADKVMDSDDDQLLLSNLQKQFADTLADTLPDSQASVVNEDNLATDAYMADGVTDLDVEDVPRWDAETVPGSPVIDMAPKLSYQIDAEHAQMVRLASKPGDIQKGVRNQLYNAIRRFMESAEEGKKEVKPGVLARYAADKDDRNRMFGFLKEWVQESPPP